MRWDFKSCIKKINKEKKRTVIQEMKNKRLQDMQKTKSKIAEISPSLSVIILCVNALKSKTIWHSGFKKKDLTLHCLQETHFISKGTNSFKVKEWKKMFHANSNQREQEWLH